MFEIVLAAIKAKAPVVLDATLRLVGARLLGKILELPEVWIDGKIQVLRDKTESRSIISNAIATEAAKRAIADPRLLQSAIDVVLLDYDNKLQNRAAVFKGTLDVVSEADVQEQLKAQMPDDDWLNAFVRYAEDASSERMQEAFSRILAGEILAKGTFSRTAMRMMYEMTPEIASAFSLVWSENLGGYAPRTHDNAALHKASVLCQEAGFLHNEMRYVGADKTLEDDEHIDHEMIIGHHPKLVVLYRQYKKDFFLELSPAYAIDNFTKVGNEIASILPKPDFETNLRKLLPHLPDQEEILNVSLVHADGVAEELAFPPKPL